MRRTEQRLRVVRCYGSASWARPRVVRQRLVWQTTLMLWTGDPPDVLIGQDARAVRTKGRQITAATGEHSGTNGGFPLMAGKETHGVRVGNAKRGAAASVLVVHPGDFLSVKPERNRCKERPLSGLLRYSSLPATKALASCGVNKPLATS